jgi:hypothetical protein
MTMYVGCGVLVGVEVLVGVGVRVAAAVCVGIGEIVAILAGVGGSGVAVGDGLGCAGLHALRKSRKSIKYIAWQDLPMGSF